MRAMGITAWSVTAMAAALSAMLALSSAATGQPSLEQRKALAADGVGFFQAGACAIAVFPSDELANDANIASEGMAENFRGIALAWNCRSEHDVDVVIRRAGEAGAVIRKPAQDAFWGGYSGYFSDLDGHLWEVAYNPHFPLTDDGRLQLPD
mgnify:CR=1 FL=1